VEFWVVARKSEVKKKRGDTCSFRELRLMTAGAGKSSGLGFDPFIKA